MHTSCRCELENPIDAVVTWVDGSDPAHRAKREATMKKLGESADRAKAIPAGKDPTRFAHNGEISWCLHAIRKFAPWIRNIHLVTDNQIPDFLTSEKQRELGVKLVDHTEIFRGYEGFLPTFNPYAIETVLWRIKELSEKFVFFNDDFFLLQPVNPRDFFKNDDVVLRGAWQRVRGSTMAHRVFHQGVNKLLRQTFGILRTMQLHAQMNGAKLVGYNERHYRSPHVPHPLKRTTFRDFFNNRPDLLEKNLAMPFRGHDDFVPVSLANHLEMKSGNPELIPYRDRSMFSGEGSSKHKVEAILSHVESGAQFICLQSLDAFDRENWRHIQKKLDALIFR